MSHATESSSEKKRSSEKWSLTLAKYRSLVLVTVFCHVVSALMIEIPDRYIQTDLDEVI